MTFLSMLFLLSLHGFGYVLVALLRIPASSVRCASAYLIGSFVATLLFFVALVFGLDIYRSLGLILSVLVPSALYAWTSKGYWIEISAMVHSFLPRNRTEQSLFILITSILCYVILMNAFWPHTDWDAITLYDFRARLLLMVGSIRPLFSSIQDIYLLSYPWYTSVLLAMQYLLGAWNGMGIFSLLAVSLVLTFFSLISSTLGRLPAFFGSLALLTVPMLFAHTMIAYSNFPYMVYWGLGICCLLSWIFSKKVEMAQLGSLLIAGSLWVRQSEPFWIIAGLLLLYGCITLRQWKVSLWLLPIIIVWRGWNNYVHSILKQVLPQNSIELATYEQGGNMLSSIQSFLDFHRWLEVLEHVARYATPIWGGWIVIIIFLILRQRRTYHRIVATITTFACVGAIVAGTYLFANNTYWKEIVDSFQRLLLFAFPVFIYSVLALVDNKKQHMTKTKCIVCLKPVTTQKFVAKTIRYFSCSNCGHVFSTSVLEKPYEDYQHVEKYEKWRVYLENVFSRRVQDIRKYQNSGRALDVGCSLGFFLNALKTHGFSAEGLEPSADAVKLCKKRGLKVYKGYLGDRLPSAGNYDVVILNHVMEHLKDPRKGCKDIFNYLKPGGVVFIESPNFTSIEGALSGKNWRYLYPEEHFSQFSPKSLSYLLKDTGFHLLSCRTYAALYDFSSLKNELIRCLLHDQKRLVFYAIEFPLSSLEMVLHRGSAVSCIARKPVKRSNRKDS